MNHPKPELDDRLNEMANHLAETAQTIAKMGEGFHSSLGGVVPPAEIDRLGLSFLAKLQDAKGQVQQVMDRARRLSTPIRPPTRLELTEPGYALMYAEEVLEGPFPAGEDAIASDAETAGRYAVNTLKRPFPKGEKAIAADLFWNASYQSALRKWEAQAAEAEDVEPISEMAGRHHPYHVTGFLWMTADDAKEVEFDLAPWLDSLDEFRLGDVFKNLGKGPLIMSTNPADSPVGSSLVQWSSGHCDEGFEEVVARAKKHLRGEAPLDNFEVEVVPTELLFWVRANRPDMLPKLLNCLGGVKGAWKHVENYSETNNELSPFYFDVSRREILAEWAQVIGAVVWMEKTIAGNELTGHLDVFEAFPHGDEKEVPTSPAAWEDRKSGWGWCSVQGIGPDGQFEGEVKLMVFQNGQDLAEEVTCNSRCTLVPVLGDDLRKLLFSSFVGEWAKQEAKQGANTVPAPAVPLPLPPRPAPTTTSARKV